jgi:hypothetical protein
MYVIRSELLLAGEMPYLDFAVNKPPLYAYMLQFLGYTVGPGEVQFRAVFSIMDAIVTVLIVFLAKCKFDEKFSFWAGFAYALCPLPIIAIGLSGHYEPIVMIFVILSLIFLLRDRYYESAFFLGIGFALKFFPIVLLPFFVWKVDSWRKRIIYVVLFALPIIISIIPILFQSSDAFWNYMYMQTYSWTAKKSYAFGLEILLGTKFVFGVKLSMLFMALFLGLILLMFISWVRKKFNVSFWFKIIIINFIIYYGIAITTSFIYYKSEFGLDNPVPLMAISAILYFPLVFFVLHKYWHYLEIKWNPKEEMFILSIFSIIFLLFSSSQYNPWYVLWPLPFILATENKRIRFLLLWLIFWNFEGIGLSLLPGLALA